MPFIPPDHQAGDANTVGGYRAVHGRPAAFEGSDGAAYTAEIVADETGDRAAPYGAYLLFVRWRHGDPVASGHLETAYLAHAGTGAAAAEALGRMLLSDAREHLNSLIAAAARVERPWWEAMRDA